MVVVPWKRNSGGIHTQMMMMMMNLEQLLE
jgi:hypothetical protein